MRISEETVSGDLRRVELCTYGRDSVDWTWPLGSVHLGMSSEVADVSRLLDGALADLVDSDLILVWDAALGRPDADRVRRIARRPGDAWHGGLQLGLAGLPTLLNSVHPTSMLGLDPPADREGTSWRVSLRAFLAPVRLWRRLGRPDAGFQSLEAAGLELGHRWLWGGALLRSVPSIATGASGTPVRLSTYDEIRFLRRRVGRRWTLWASARSVLGHSRPAREIVSALRRTRTVSRSEPPSELDAPEPQGPDPRFDAPRDGLPGPASPPTVSVLIPTVDRYPYLERMLTQLAEQTVAPHEVLVIDQTDRSERRRDWHDPPGLPLRVLERDQAGQCSSRNAGLREATGEMVLFLDDDDEIEPDLIERHLARLAASRADVVCGVADEAGAGPLPAEFRRRRASDVFPTNNGSVRTATLRESGLFDLAYDRGARADADLGMRLHRSGALMVLDPEIRVFHHRAPRGGLRRHGARRHTFARSRRRIFARHLPSATEIYLRRRYFTPAQVRESLWISVASTFAVRGGAVRRIVKLVWALMVLPDTLVRLAWRLRRARKWLETYPQIPTLGGDGP